MGESAKKYIHILLAITTSIFSTVFTSCESEEPTGGRIPPGVFYAIDALDAEQECGMVIYDSETQFYWSAHFPSNGGKFMLRASLEEIDRDEWELNGKDKSKYSEAEDFINIIQIYSPVSGQFYEIDEDCSTQIPAESGITGIKRISRKKIEISFAPNRTGDKIEYKFKLHEGNKDSNEKGTFRFIIWPEGSAVDRYYSGELTRKQVIEKLNNI